MLIQYISLKQGQHLDQVLSAIPTNTILDKTICGCGATTLEIKSDRHSIIIEPNVPVILGKCKVYPNMLGVTEEVDTKQIIAYLNDNWNDGHHKIMTTPEGFVKVAKAIRSVNLSLHEDFFLLFDECEKVVQDSAFRKKIILPLDDFFRCKGKAMVSATPVEFMDPRFDTFTKIKIVPDYDYKAPISLHPTNNVCHALKQVVEENVEQDQKVFVFCNSPKLIRSYIEQLNIKDESNIYCSEDSAEKQQELSFVNSFSALPEDGENSAFNKYNFLTSRFYSAVDIKLSYKPVVIMITDVFGAKYTKIDPLTEAVQIIGRFRNGFEKFFHITNYNTKARSPRREVVIEFLEEQYDVYQNIFRKNWLQRSGQGARKILEQAMNKVDFKDFVLPNGQRNYFMYQNFIREKELDGVYKKMSYIKREYLASKAFEITYKPMYYQTKDEDRKVLNPNVKIAQNERNKWALEQIEKLLKSTSKCSKWDKLYLDELKKSFELLIEGIKILKFDKLKVMAQRGWLTNKNLETLINKVKIGTALQHPRIHRTIQNSFVLEKQYTATEVKTILARIFDRYQIPYDEKPTVNWLEKFFEVEKGRSNDKRWIKIIRPIPMQVTKK